MKIGARGVVGLVLALGACGREPAGDGGGGSVAVAQGARWNARDACAALGRDAAAKAGGAAVTGMKPEQISAGGNGLAAASSCSFSYPNGATLIVVTREAPDADATPEAIENARTGGGLAPPSDPLPGLGKAAFWGSQTKQLQVFVDDRRYVAVNFFNLRATDDAKARSIAVAKALL